MASFCDSKIRSVSKWTRVSEAMIAKNDKEEWIQFRLKYRSELRDLPLIEGLVPSSFNGQFSFDGITTLTYLLFTTGIFIELLIA